MRKFLKNVGMFTVMVLVALFVVGVTEGQRFEEETKGGSDEDGKAGGDIGVGEGTKANNVGGRGGNGDVEGGGSDGGSIDSCRG